jgi:hypothetical protein
MIGAIKFQNLTLGYDRLPAVQELDAEVQEGSLTADRWSEWGWKINLAKRCHWGTFSSGRRYFD